MEDGNQLDAKPKAAPAQPKNHEELPLQAQQQQHFSQSEDMKPIESHQAAKGNKQTEEEDTPPRLQLVKGTSRNNNTPNGEFQYSVDNVRVPQISHTMQATQRSQTIISVEVEIPYLNNGVANGGNRTIEMVNSTYGTASEAIDSVSVKGRFRVQERALNGLLNNASHEDGMYSSTDHHNGFSQQIQGNVQPDEVAAVPSRKEASIGNQREVEQRKGPSEYDSPLVLQGVYHSPIDYDKGVKALERMSQDPLSRASNNLLLKSPDEVLKSSKPAELNQSIEKGQSKSSFGRLNDIRKEQTEKSKQSIHSQKSQISHREERRQKQAKMHDSDDNLADREDNNLIQNQFSHKNSFEQPQNEDQVQTEEQKPNENIKQNTKKFTVSELNQRKMNILNTGPSYQVQDDHENEADESSAAYQEDQNNEEHEGDDNDDEDEKTLGDAKNDEQDQANDVQNATANFNKQERISAQQEDSYFDSQRYKNPEKDSFASQIKLNDSMQPKIDNGNLLQQRDMRSDISEKDNDSSRDITGSQTSITSLQQQIKENTDQQYNQNMIEKIKVAESNEKLNQELNGSKFSHDLPVSGFENLRAICGKEVFFEKNPSMKLPMRSEATTPLQPRHSVRLQPLERAREEDEDDKNRDNLNEEEVIFTQLAKKQIESFDQRMGSGVTSNIFSKLKHGGHFSEISSKKHLQEGRRSTHTPYLSNSQANFKVTSHQDESRQHRKHSLKKQETSSTINVNTNSLKKGRQKINEESNESGSQNGRDIIRIDESAVQQQLELLRKKEEKLRDTQRPTKKQSQPEKMILIIDRKGQPLGFTDKEISVIPRNKKNKFLLRLPSGKLIKANQTASQIEQSYLERHIDFPQKSQIYFTEEKFKNPKAHKLKSKQKSHLYKNESQFERQGSKQKQLSKRKGEQMNAWKDKNQSNKKAKQQEECQQKGRFFIKNSIEDQEAVSFRNGGQRKGSKMKSCKEQCQQPTDYCQMQEQINNRFQQLQGQNGASFADQNYFFNGKLSGPQQSMYMPSPYFPQSPVHPLFQMQMSPLPLGQNVGQQNAHKMNLNMDSDQTNRLNQPFKPSKFSLKKRHINGYDEDGETSSITSSSMVSGQQKSIDAYGSEEEKKADLPIKSKPHKRQNQDEVRPIRMSRQFKRAQREELEDAKGAKGKPKNPMINQVFNNHGMNYNILNHENNKLRHNQYLNQQHLEQHLAQQMPHQYYQRPEMHVQYSQPYYPCQYQPQAVKPQMGMMYSHNSTQQQFESMNNSMTQMFCSMMQSHNQLMNTLMMQNSVSEANASYSYGSESSSPERQNDSMENASMGISSDTSEAEDSQGDAYYRDQQRMKSVKSKENSEQMKLLQRQIESLQKQLTRVNEKKPKK